MQKGRSHPSNISSELVLLLLALLVIFSIFFQKVKTAEFLQGHSPDLDPVAGLTVH
jgi:hypothetical protein